MSQKSNRERSQVENKLNLDFLERDEKFWQEKLEHLAKSLTILDEKIISDDEHDVKESHSEDIFNIRCKCSCCLTFRNLIVGIHGESKAYNDLWSKLRGIISSYYTLLTNEEELAVVEQKYENLLKESYGIKWSSDGSFDVKKNIHASLGNLTFSNESSSHQQIQTFIVVFNMLYTRDPHQLFELLCLQLTSTVLSYKEGVKELTKSTDENGTEFYRPEDFINHILDGYETMTNIAKTLSPLVSEMSGHLEKFSLDWIVMNQCMYYRFLYHDDIENQMAECILRLKDALDIEKYKSFVYRFLKFDEKMNRIGKTWEKALISLEKYRKSANELLRSERIFRVRKMFDKLQSSGLNISECDTKCDPKASPLDWIVSSEDDDFWAAMLFDIKQEHLDRKVSKTATNKNCKCWACLMAEDSTTQKEKCFNIDDHISSEDQNAEDSEIYHISWAVFKHLQSRVTYPKNQLDPGLFCIFKHPTCKNLDCHVAVNLLIGFFPLEFTKFLLKNYIPLEDEERKEILDESKQDLISKQEIDGDDKEIRSFLLSSNSLWSNELTENKGMATRSELASALAESCPGANKFPPKNVMISYFHALFHVTDGDISMDPEWLEKINKGQLLKHDELKTPSNSKTKQIFELDGLEMSLKDLKLTAEISADASEDNLEAVVQMSMREVAQKLSTLSFADDDENTRNVLENEMKKPIVEALKLAASNKKLEAELKSLQKEHNMLKNMVKGLEQIHEEKKDILNEAVAKAHHQSHHAPDAESSKGDAGSGCVCYYCSLFGKNQEISARSAETRDRLRKRLHHLQNQKEHSKVKNLKNIGLRLKSEICGDSADCTHNKPASKSPTLVAPIVQTPPKLVKVESAKPQVEVPKKPLVVKTRQEHKSVEVRPQPPIPQYENVNSLLEFIEGPSSKAVEEIRRAEEIAAKKQLKKLKQIESKNRKLVEDHMQDIRKFNNILQDNAIELKQCQHRQTQLKSAKSRNQDPKRIKAAEIKVNELKAKKCKLEGDVKQIFAVINDLCPTFNLTRECTDLKNVLTILHPDGLPNDQKQNVQKSTANASSTHAQSETLKIEPTVQLKQIHNHPQNIPLHPNQPTVALKKISIQVPPKINEDDPAKRMVTIRRINLPHAEPQVTVTAKGTTNDMDQLLYTFVNGQLVPASSLPKTAFQNGSIQLFTSDESGKKNAVSFDKKSAELKPPVQEKQHDEETVKSLRREEKKRKKQEKQQMKLLEQQKKDEDKKQEQERKRKLKEEKKRQEAREEMRQRRTKKQLIDPEFAKNPFMLLDDEGVSSSDEETSSTISNCTQERKGEADTANINEADQKKNIPKDPIKNQNFNNSTQKASANNKQNQAKKKQLTERKDSLASVSSSNSSSKSAKQPSFKPVETVQKFQQEFSQATQSKSNFVPVQPVNSLMDQLNRGIKVEGLRLPPGITLTKVPPSDIMNSKRESISRITQPLSEATSSSNNQQIANPNFGNPNDLFMVQAAPFAETSGNKKKNKKKRNKTDENVNQSSNNERIVTLKNPMFFNNTNNNTSEPVNSMMRNLQTPPFVLPAGEPQQASIIRNENGMFTIRNPTFHQNAFGGNPNSNPNGAFGTRQNNVSDNSQFYEPQNDNLQQTKCSSVIGSEMKNMLQRKKEQEFASMDPYFHQSPMQQQRHCQQSAYQQFGNPSYDRGTVECENYLDSGTYPIINFEDLRCGQMLNSEVSVHNVKESKIFQNSLKRSPQNMFGDIINARSIPNTNAASSADPINGNGDSWLNANKSSLHHILTEDYEKRQNNSTLRSPSNSNSPISVTSLEEIYDSDSKHQKLPSFYSNHHFHHDDKSSGASSLFSSGI